MKRDARPTRRGARRLVVAKALAYAATCAGAAWWSGAVAAQVASPAGSTPAQQVQRQQRFEELQQLEIDNRLRANTDVPPEQRALIDYGGYVTLSYLSLDDHQNNNHNVRQSDFVLYGRLNLDAANELFARGRLSYENFSEGDRFEGSREGWQSVQLERGYYRFDLAKYEGAYHGKTLPYNVTVQLGRDLVYWANGLTLGQVLDGGIFDFSWKNLSLEIIAGITAPQTVDFDTSRPAYAYNTHRGFYGGFLSYNISTENAGTHRPFVYALLQRDLNTHDFLQQGNVATSFDYNSFYFGFGSTGAIGDHLVYGIENTFETGNTLSNSFRVNGIALEPIPQTRNNIEAFAADYRLDYLFNDVRNSRASGEVIWATGDPDRQNANNTFGGNRPGTKDFGFNGFGLVNTGLAFAPEVSNLFAVRVGASTYPFANTSTFRRMQVGTDLFLFDKLQRHNAFDERTANKYYLGWEPDVYLNWQITSDVTLAVRYGVFVPNSSLFNHENNRQFLYTGMTFAF